MEDLKHKYEEIISTQKDQILKEQLKVKQLEDELLFKQNELRRKSEVHDNNVRRENAEIKIKALEVEKYKENIDRMLLSEQKLISEEREKLKKEREELFAEKFSVEEHLSNIRREKEQIDLERGNFEKDKSLLEEEKEHI